MMRKLCTTLWINQNSRGCLIFTTDYPQDISTLLADVTDRGSPYLCHSLLTIIGAISHHVSELDPIDL